MHTFRITGLSPEPFLHLYGCSDDELAKLGVQRVVVDSPTGHPDRVEMREIQRGENALLLNYMHLDVPTPYRSSHAIYVREGASGRYDRTNEVPDIMRARQLSLRAYDRDGMMIDADVMEGTQLEVWIEKFFSNAAIAYLHAHNAKRGCYSGRIDRA